MTLQVLLDAIAKNGNVSERDARQVVRTYQTLRLVSHNAHDGYTLKHGALLDNAVIARALTQERA